MMWDVVHHLLFLPPRVTFNITGSFISSTVMPRLSQSRRGEPFEHTKVTLIWGGHQSRAQPWSALITAARMKRVNSLSGCCFALGCWAIVYVWWAIMISLCRRRGLLLLPAVPYTAHLFLLKMSTNDLLFFFVYGGAWLFNPRQDLTPRFVGVRKM